jgi:hypothetical protein
VINILVEFYYLDHDKKDLEDLRSNFNNQNLSLLRYAHFKATKKLFELDKFTYRILDSYESLNKINLEKCERALNKFDKQKFQIKILLEPFEGNTGALKNFSEFLLGGNHLHSLLKSGDIKNTANDYPF